MPVSGHVVDLVTASVGAVRGAIVGGAGQEVHWVSGSGPGRKRIRLNRRNSCTPRQIYGSISSTGVEEVASCVSIPDHKRRRGDQDDGGSNPAQVRTGVG